MTSTWCLVSTRPTTQTTNFDLKKPDDLTQTEKVSIKENVTIPKHITYTHHHIRT